MLKNIVSLSVLLWGIYITWLALKTPMPLMFQIFLIWLIVFLTIFINQNKPNKEA